jgi:RecA-family ATPase
MPNDVFDDAFSTAFDQARRDPEVARFRPTPERATPAPEPFDLPDPRGWNGHPPARRWNVKEWIPRGTVTALYGDGGVGKSLLAQQLLTCTAMALPWLGLETAGGRALGVMCEDDDDELHRRQVAINAHLGIGMENLENLRLLSRVGENNILMSFPPRGGVGELSAVFERLDLTCRAFKPTLLVGDTIADFFGGSEIDRGQVRQFVQNAFGRLARDHQCAVVIAGHPSASGMSSGSGTGGSTAWSNTVRSRLYLTRPQAKEGEEADPDVRVLSRMKANYAPREATIQLRYQDGVFVEMDGAGGRATLEWPDIQAVFTEIQRAWDAGRPWSLAPQTKKDGRFLPLWAEMHLGVSARAVARLAESWLAGGYLASETRDAKAKVKGLRVVRWLDPTS